MHKLFGIPFKFPGLLNFPFYSEIVKFPGNPLPGGILNILIFLQSYGILFYAIAIFGAFLLYKKSKKLFKFLVLWNVLVFGLFFFQEN